MKIFSRKLLKDYLFIFCLFLCSNYAFAGSHAGDVPKSGNFAQLSSTQNQAPGIGTQTVILENVNHLFGLKVNPSHKKIIVQEPGLYFIMASSTFRVDWVLLV